MSVQNNVSRNAGWWVIATSIFYQAFIIGIFLYCFTFWIADWSEEFSAPVSRVVLALTFGNIGAAIAALFIAKLLDKTPVVKVVGAGIVTFSIGLCLVAQATALWHIVLIYTVILGAAVCSIGPLSGQLLAVKWFDKRRSVAIGWVSIGSSLGGFICPPLVTLLVIELGWRQTHLVLAALCFLLVLPIALLMVKEPQNQGITTPNNPVQDANTSSYFEILRAKKFWLLLLALAPFICAIYVYVVNLAPYGSDLGLNTAQIAFVMSLMAICMVFGKVISGFLFDYLGTKRLLLLLSLILSCSLLVLMNQPSYSMLIGASLFYGFSAGSYLTMSGALVNDLYKPADFPIVFGLILISNIWVYLFVPIGAMAREYTGSYDIVWLAVLVLTGIGVFASLSVSRLVRQVAI